MKTRVYTRLVSRLLAICTLVGMIPVTKVQAAEIRAGLFDPRTGNLTLEFGYQYTQYVDINIYVSSVNAKSGTPKTAKGSIAKGFLLTGAGELGCGPATAETELPYEVTKATDPGLKGISNEGIYQTTVNFAGNTIPPTDMMRHILTWDGTINGVPIIGPNLNEDIFILTIEIEPLGRPEKNEINIDADGNISGSDYSWTHANGSKRYAASTDILVDYRSYIEGNGQPRFIMLKGGLSDQIRQQMYEDFLSGSMNCAYLTKHPEISSLVMMHSNLDPVDMVTGNYQFTYTDMKVEGAIPLTFIRAYNSRYAAGSFGKGFTHSYEYTLTEERGIVSVTMPGGEEQVFLRLDDTYTADYDSLQDSDFTLHDTTGGGYIMRHKDGAEFQFTSGGKLTQVRNPDGIRVAALTYSGNNLTRIDGVAGSYTLTWSGGHITRVADNAGRTTQYAYSGSNLTSVTNCDGSTLRYTYDRNGFLATVSDFEGEVYVKNTYDKSGRVTEQHFWNADQELVSTICYDDDNLVTTCVDFNGQTTKYYYDAHRNIIKIEDPNGASTNEYTNYVADSVTNNQGNVVSYDRNSKGDVTKIHYQDGTADSITYDSNGHIIAIKDAKGGTEYFSYSGASVTSYKDKNGNTTWYEYNSLGLLSKVTDALGGVTQYNYNSAGRLTSVTDAENNTVRYHYDSVGRVAEETDALGNQTTYTYTAAGKLTGTRDALGNTTTYAYNANGIQTKTTDALGNSVSIEYGSNGQPLSETDQLGNVTTYTYNDKGLISQITDPMGNATQYRYDEQGRLIKIVEADGSETSCTYDSLNRITSTTDGLANKTAFDYDAMGRITCVTEANGAKTRYAYDQIGQTIQVTDAENGKTTFTYDAYGNLLSTTDAQNTKTSSTYDKLNRVATTTDGEGNVTSYTYDAVGRVVQIQDALKGKTSYTYDSNGNVLTEKDAAGHTTSYTYDALNRLVTITDANGGKTTNTYDAVSNLIAVKDSLGNVTNNSYYADGRIKESVDPLGNATRYAYNANGQTESVTNADGGSVLYEYNATGVVSKITDPLGNVTFYEYDANGQTSKVTNALGDTVQYAYDNAGNVVETYVNGELQASAVYDQLNRLTAVTDSKGSTVYTTYDKVGNVLSATDWNGNTTTYSYNRNYRPIKVVDAAGGVTAYEYDAFGNILTETDAEGGTIRYAYNDLGQLESTTNALGGVISFTYDGIGNIKTETDALGAVTTYSYDLNGNLVATTDAQGNTVVNTYDANGNIIKSTNGERETTSFEYDSMNRLIKATDAMNHRETYTYDQAGNLLSFTDGKKNTVEYEYDGLNNRVAEISPQGRRTEYAYDAYGNVTEMTVDAGGDARATTSYAFDREGNLLTETSPQGNTRSYEYNSAGNITKITDENGRVTTYTRNVLGYTTEIADEDGVTSYTYDKLGHMLTASGPTGTVSFAYDALYRTTAIVNEDGTTTGYTYDIAGNQTGIVYPDGTSIRYTYDSVGNITSMTDYDGSGSVYAYDAEGRIVKDTHSDGSTTEYAYNNNGQIIQQTEVSRDNSTVRETLYGYDDVGNLKSEQRSGVDVDKKDEDVRYYYDKDNQLIKTVQNGETTNYQYDAAGNMISDGKYAYTYNDQNQLLTKAGSDGTTEYTYDAVGNLIKKVSGDEATEYTYNAQNQMIRGENSDGSYSEYTYNALGARIKNVQYRPNANSSYANAELDNGSSHIKNYLPVLEDDRATGQPTWESEVGSVHQNEFETITKHYTVDYLSEANRDIMVSVEGVYDARYAYDMDGFCVSTELSYADGTARGESGENPASDIAAKDISKVWYRSNLVGSSLYAVDQNGNTVSHMVYDAWGKPQTESATDENLMGLEGLNNYTGYSWDETLELYYAQNRFYDVETHRFTQKDPIEDGTNWYEYVANNPLMNVDPYGLSRRNPAPKQNSKNSKNKKAAELAARARAQAAQARVQYTQTWQQMRQAPTAQNKMVLAQMQRQIQMTEYAALRATQAARSGNNAAAASYINQANAAMYRAQNYNSKSHSYQPPKTVPPPTKITLSNVNAKEATRLKAMQNEARKLVKEDVAPKVQEVAQNAIKSAVSSIEPILCTTTQAKTNITIVNASKDLIGTHTTTVMNTELGNPKEILPSGAPIQVTYGARETITVEKSGDPSTFAAYVTHDMLNPTKSSTAGLSVSIGGHEVKAHSGWDNLGMTGSYTNGNVTHTSSLKINLAELSIVYEASVTETIDGTATTDYANIKVKPIDSLLYYLVGSTASDAIGSFQGTVPAAQPAFAH